MYSEITKRNGLIIDCEIAALTEAIIKSFEAEETVNDLSEIGYLELFCGAGFVPVGQKEEVCVADDFYAENRLSLTSINSKYFRRGTKPRGKNSGGHLIFPLSCRMAIRC